MTGGFVMAKKTRPTFSAPRDKAASRPSGAPWVYRSSDAGPVLAGGASTAESPRETVGRRTLTAAPAAAPARSSGAVTCAAWLLFPVAVITGLVVQPLAACCRRKP
jgi:hypothetical protein